MNAGLGVVTPEATFRVSPPAAFSALAYRSQRGPDPEPEHPLRDLDPERAVVQANAR